MLSRIVGKYEKNIRIIRICIGIIIVIIMVCFLRVQMDDERYYMMYDFEDVQDEVYDDRGILHADDSILSSGDILCCIPAIHLEPGSYLLQVNHQQDTDSEIRILDHNTLISKYILPASELDSVFQFDTDHDLYHLTVQFIYSGGNVDIKHAYIRSKGIFYTDTLAAGFFFILLVIVLAVFCIHRDVMSMSHRERFFLFVFPVFFVLLNYICYREYGQRSIGGDYSFWVGKIEQTKNELLNFQFPVQIYGDALNGHGVLGALYPGLFIYCPAILRLLHVSMSTTLCITFILINSATMYTSYYSVKSITNDRLSSCVCMVVYTMAPYRLGCMYFRMAMGELFAIIFIPLVMLGLYEIFIRNERRWMILVIGLSGILESHVITTVIVCGFCILMGILMIKYLFRDRRWSFLLRAMLVFCLINLWYIVPFVECYGYDLRLVQSFAVGDFYNTTFEPSQLFTIFESMASVGERYKTPMLGFALWFFLLMVSYYFIFSNIRKGEERFVGSVFAISCLFLFMQLRWFPWQTLQKFETIRNIVQMIQFPTRFGSVAQAGLVFCGGIVLARSMLYQKYRIMISCICVVSACILFIIISDSWLMQGIENPDIGDIVFRPDIDVLDNDDYALASYNAESFTNKPTSQAHISDYQKHGTTASFYYVSDSDTYVVLPIQAYPGYKAYGSDGQELNSSVTENAELRVFLPKQSNKTQVQIRYVQPVLWRIALIISIITLMVLIVYYKVGLAIEGTIDREL